MNLWKEPFALVVDLFACVHRDLTSAQLRSAPGDVCFGRSNANIGRSVEGRSGSSYLHSHSFRRFFAVLVVETPAARMFGFTYTRESLVIARVSSFFAWTIPTDDTQFN